MSAESRWWRLLRRAVRFRVVLYVLVALVVLDVLVRSSARRWRDYDPVYYRERVAACRREQWDVVVVGGSPAMCGIDANILSGVRWQGRPLERAFNFGLPLATTAEVCHAVEHGLRRPPRLLLYGIAATDLNGSRFEPNGPRRLMNARDLLRWARARPDTVHLALWHHTLERCGRLWALSHYGEGIRLWAADQVGGRWPDLCPEATALARRNLYRTELLRSRRGVTPSGPVAPNFRLDHLKASGQPVPPFPFLDRYRVDGYLAYLHRLFDWAERHTVPLVLVNMPVAADLEERLHPQAFATYRATLTKLAEARGVRVLWPTREQAGLTDAHFSDLIHLNADGAARLSVWIRRAVEGLPSR